MFDKKYKKLVQKHLYGDIEEELEKLKNKVLTIFKASDSEIQDWNGDFIDSIPKAMAYTFTMWTLMNSEYF